MATNPEFAETLALQALGWLAGDEDLLPVFLGATGAGIDDLRRGASDPAFLGAVLDFLLMNDAWITSFCDANGLAYDAVQGARAALPGGEQVSWT